MGIAIKVENVSKKYRLGELSTGTFSKDLENLIKSKLFRLKDKYDINSGINNSEYVWSLKNINFELEEGNVLGLIGKNGAGKSTLLKILSQITRPTSGSIKTKGRIASLLEVGTGFHPELTGRENVFLNGAILGMRKREIEKKFDEIVDFSGVEKFIDTPVKRYSSGMYVRLAFAVAANLESEILIVDEVLAVGDADFQNKCLGKMDEVSKNDGRTILFVSHNMTAVEKLCNSLMIIDGGVSDQITFDVRKGIASYLNRGIDNFLSPIFVNNSQDHPNFKLIEFFISDTNGPLNIGTQQNNTDKFINIKYYCSRVDPALEISFRIFNDGGDLVFSSSNTDLKYEEWINSIIGENLIYATIPKNLLNEGTYKIQLFVSLYRKEWIIDSANLDVSIYLQIAGGLSDSPHWISRREGLLAPIIKWSKVN